MISDTFLFRGTVGRLGFALSLVPIVVASAMAESLADGKSALLGGLFIFASFWLAIGASVRRCRDINQHPAWALTLLIPFFNCVSVFILVFSPGWSSTWLRKVVSGLRQVRIATGPPTPEQSHEFHEFFQQTLDSEILRRAAQEEFEREGEYNEANLRWTLSRFARHPEVSADHRNAVALLASRIAELGTAPASTWGPVLQVALKSIGAASLLNAPLDLTIRIVAKVAKCDGVVAPEEIAAVDHFFLNVVGMSTTERNQAVEIFRSAKDANEDLSSLAREFLRVTDSDHGAKEALFSLVLEVVHADGEVSTEEDKAMRELSAVLGIEGYQSNGGAGSSSGSHSNSRQQGFAERSEVDAAYETLGLERGATKEEIKKRYRRMMLDWHPDRLPPSVSDEIRRVAEEKSKEINGAYELLSRIV